MTVRREGALGTGVATTGGWVTVGRGGALGTGAATTVGAAITGRLEAVSGATGPKFTT